MLRIQLVKFDVIANSTSDNFFEGVVSGYYLPKMSYILKLTHPPIRLAGLRELRKPLVQISLLTFHFHLNGK